MECLSKRNHLAAVGVKRSEFQRVFVGLCAGVHEEEFIIAVTADYLQLLRQFLLKRNAHRIGIETDFLNLFDDAFHIVGLRVSDADDTVSAIKVEIFFTLSVSEFQSFGTLNGYRVEFKNFKCVHFALYVSFNDSRKFTIFFDTNCKKYQLNRTIIGLTHFNKKQQRVS